MATLRQLADDGLESLGTVTFGPTLAVGDPTALAAAAGSGDWHGTGVRPGTWHVLGRPWARDRDRLEEIVLVHEQGLARFYDLYDEAGPAAAFVLPSGRVAALDGRLRTDPALLGALLEPDELPWILDGGLVASGLEQHPAHVAHTRGDVLLVSIGLDRAPSAGASTDPHASSDPEREAE